jgi:hypothetical protein
VVRGALGSLFRELNCVPECAAASTCERWSVCPYARIFEPPPARSGPSGFRDRPRPFVIRANHLDGLTIEAGREFYFDVHVFYAAEPELGSFIGAFEALARTGIGPNRGRAELLCVGQAGSGLTETVWLPGTPISKPEPMRVPLSAKGDACTAVTVRFVTPTELKAGSVVVETPDFAVLFGRIRDRISALRSLYGSGPLDIDFAAMGNRAAQIRLVSSDLRYVDRLRTSSRTGQTHGIGGFTGHASYAGDLAEFLPYLEAARWTGVGRQTVWGKGVLAVERDA